MVTIDVICHMLSVINAISSRFVMLTRAVTFIGCVVLIAEKCNSTTEFTCNNYDCVSLEAHCDGLYDCEDRSDEYGCCESLSSHILLSIEPFAWLVVYK